MIHFYKRCVSILTVTTVALWRAEESLLISRLKVNQKDEWSGQDSKFRLKVKLGIVGSSQKIYIIHKLLSFDS